MLAFIRFVITDTGITLFNERLIPRRKHLVVLVEKVQSEERNAYNEPVAPTYNHYPVYATRYDRLLGQEEIVGQGTNVVEVQGTLFRIRYIPDVTTKWTLATEDGTSHSIHSLARSPDEKWLDIRTTSV